MRLALVLTASLLAPSVFAASNLEGALAKTGATVVKAVHALDSVDPSDGPGSATLSAVSLSNPKDAAFKPKGIAIAVDDASDRKDSITTAYIDADEIDGLIGSLDWMAKSMAEWEGKEDREQTEAAYTTRGGFSAGFTFSSGKSAAYAKAGNSRIQLDADGLKTLRGVLKIGQDYLKGAK